MKTIVIWDSYGEKPIRFFVLEGDFAYLNDTYLNSIGDEAKQDELNGILVYDDNGKPAVEMLDSFPLPAEIDDVVIICGFVP